MTTKVGTTQNPTHNKSKYTIRFYNPDGSEFGYSESVDDVPGLVSDDTSMVGDDRANWRRVIASRENAVNSVYGIRTHTEMGTGDSKWTQKQFVSAIDDAGNQYFRLGVFETLNASLRIPFVPLPTSLPDWGNLSENAKAAFVQKCISRISLAQGGTIIGEIRKTIDMIRHPAQLLRNSLQDYLYVVKNRAKGFKTVRKKNKIVAGTWLEFTFGWVPLIRDVQDASRALARVVSNIPPLEKVSVTVKDESTDIVAGSYSVGQSSWSFDNVTKTQVKSACYGAINLSVSRPTSVLSAFGLRPHDFFPTVWELIPYSFVIDYFTNIGDMIAAVSFPTSYLAWWGQTNVRRSSCSSENFQDITVNGSAPPYVIVEVSGTPGFARRTYEEIVRSVPITFVPSLTFQIPGLKQGFNIAALVQQARATRL